jgi:hypothetical protein
MCFLTAIITADDQTLLTCTAVMKRMIRSRLIG